MADKIIKSFDVWITAKGLKSKGRLRSIDNISLEGVAKIRELILEFAIRGKLVSQDPKEETASTLLKLIANEKDELIKQGKLKPEKPLPEIKDEEVPFRMPNGWSLARLGEITNKIGSGSTPRGGRESYEREGILFLRSQNIWNHGIELNDVAFISKETHEAMSGTKVMPNDILLNITGGSLGRSTIFPTHLGEANISQHVTIIRPTNPETRAFLHLCIISPYGQRLIWGRQVGANREGLSKKVLELFEIPIPPLAEQHRIVAKVDELMTLCDELEKQENHHLKSHQLLIETLLNTLTKPNDAAQFQTAWSRLAQHFEDVFLTEDCIDQLKRAILQLAVMGKLGPQDPNDEPASELLKRIQKEKERLVDEGEIKKQERLTEIETDEVPFKLPYGWIWTKLGNLSADIHYGYTASANEQLSDVRLLRITDIQNDSVNWETVPGCEIDEKKVEDYLLEDGDILIARTGGTIGKSYLVTGANLRSVFASYLIRVRRIEHMYPNYVKTFLGSQLYWEQLLDSSMGTGQPNVNGNALKNLLIPLPPFNEQLRIVSKVNELFALCDRLKERIVEAQKVVNQMADSILENVV